LVRLPQIEKKIFMASEKDQNLKSVVTKIRR